MSHQYPKLILPKGYISWTQLDLWIKNPTRYKSEYFEDGKRLDTRYLRFGGEFSRIVERLGELYGNGPGQIPQRYAAILKLKEEFPMDENMESVLMELDIDGISEFQIGNSGKEGDTTPVCKIRGEVPILAYLDKYIEKNGAIGEYKTGLVEWTLAKVQKHGQLLYYGVGLKWSGKPLPPHADLHWIETKESEQERVDFWRDGAKIISATGRIKSFHREFDEREFDRMEDLIIKTALEISDAYQEHLAQL